MYPRQYTTHHNVQQRNVFIGNSNLESGIVYGGSNCTKTHEGDATIESKLYLAVTGNEIDEEGLNRIGERVFNLERAVLAREDPRGKKVDELPEFNFTTPLQFEMHIPGCVVPGKDEPISKKGTVVDREKFTQMLGEYYELRGWDRSGLQTKQKLVELDLEDIAQDLAQRGLIS